MNVGDRVILKKTAESIFRLSYNFSEQQSEIDNSEFRGTILQITDSPFTNYKLFQVKFDGGQTLWIMENHLEQDEILIRKNKISTILKGGNSEKLGDT